MVLRTLALPLIFAASGGAASFPPAPRRLRASLPQEGTTGSSSATDLDVTRDPTSSRDVPYLSDGRQRELRGEISAQCLNTLVASADKNGKLKKVNYFVFTDGMSNGFYTFSNVISYSGLPMKNKSSATSP